MKDYFLYILENIFSIAWGMSLNQDGLILTLKIFKQSSSYIKYGQREEMQKKRRGKIRE